MSLPLAKNFWPDFKPGMLVVSLSVAKPSVPEHITAEANEQGLLPKAESSLHISVVVSENARKLRAAVAAQENQKEAEQSIKELFESFAWEYSSTGEYFLHENTYGKQALIDTGEEDLTPHTRRTIVLKVDLPDIKVFYTKLNKMLGVTLPSPVPHITLFSWSDYEAKMLYGIGICSEEEFKEYTKEVL